MSYSENLVTQAEFARAQNVSRKTVTIWKREGRLVMNGNRIDVAASIHRLGRRARIVQDDAPAPVTLPTVEALFSPEVLPAEAIIASVAIEQGAADLARLLVVRMPQAEAREIVEAWVAAQRAGWVGGPGHPVSTAEAEEWPLPAGCDRWSDHPIFNGPALPASAWAEITTETATT